MNGELLPLPRHIGIIMDGNGRWAKKRLLPRSAGHRAGAKTLQRIVLHCKKIGIQVVTVYAFSTENWKRPPEEVETLKRLFDEFITETQRGLADDPVHIRFIGDPSAFGERLAGRMTELTRQTAQYQGLCVNIAVNYGGRDELCRAIRALMRDGVKPEAVSEQTIAGYLDTAGQPDPDLIIRPSGEMRLSNFLLWQAAYSELWFSDVLWPDFTPAHLDAAVLAYRQRNRRFGDV